MTSGPGSVLLRREIRDPHLRARGPHCRVWIRPKEEECHPCTAGPCEWWHHQGGGAIWKEQVS